MWKLLEGVDHWRTFRVLYKNCNSIICDLSIILSSKIVCFVHSRDVVKGWQAQIKTFKNYVRIYLSNEP